MTPDQLAFAIDKHKQDSTAEERYAEFTEVCASSPEMLAMILNFAANDGAHPLVFVFFGMELTRYLRLDPLPEAEPKPIDADDKWAESVVSEKPQ